MAAKASKTVRRPVFGPPVTRDMFESRWLDRMSKVSNKYQEDPGHSQHPEAVKKRTAVDVDRYSDLFSVVLYCRREAKALGIIEPRWQPDTEGVLEYVDDLYGVIFDEVEIYRKWKNGQPRDGTVRWQDLPLAVRRKMTALMEEMGKAQERGEWPKNEQCEALYQKLNEKYKAAKAAEAARTEKGKASEDAKA